MSSDRENGKSHHLKKLAVEFENGSVIISNPTAETPLYAPPIGPLHPTGDGFLSNDDGSFIMDGFGRIDWGEINDRNIPIVDTEKRFIVSTRRKSGGSYLEKTYKRYVRKCNRLSYKERLDELWNTDLMYEGVRRMLWLEDIEFCEAMPWGFEYHCEYCGYDIIAYTERVAGMEPEPLIRREDYREHSHPEWGIIHDWTEIVTCPRCYHVSSWETGYP